MVSILLSLLILNTGRSALCLFPDYILFDSINIIVSLFIFFLPHNRFHNFINITFSGECADEIFGGYPWYTRPEDINADTFPWSKSVGARKQLLSNDLKSLDLEGYLREFDKRLFINIAIQ